MPFYTNIISPKAHKITQDLFLEILLNPPHTFDKILIGKGAATCSIDELTVQLASKMFLAYQLLDNASSLFGLTSKQIMIVGLVKLDSGGIVVEFKTAQDQSVLDWIKSSLQSLGLEPCF